MVPGAVGGTLDGTPPLRSRSPCVMMPAKA